MDVGPEFLYDDRERVVAKLRGPNARSVFDGSVGPNEQMRIARCADISTARMIAVGRDRG